MKFKFVKVGTPEYDKMKEEDKLRDQKNKEQADVLAAVSLLASKGWTCVAPQNDLPKWMRLALKPKPCDKRTFQIVEEYGFLEMRDTDGYVWEVKLDELAEHLEKETR